MNEKASAVDVAKYILIQAGRMTSMKLQKLVYYSQAWSLVWDEEPIFTEPIEAWANGPVVRALYDLHRGQFTVDETFRHGNIENLTENQKDSIDKVLEGLKDKTGQWLSELTHMEAPWKNARGDLQPTERGDKIILLADMHEYYSSL